MAEFYIGKLLELGSNSIPSIYGILDEELKKYGLVRNVTDARMTLSARRQNEPEGTIRFQIDEYRGPSSDFGWATFSWIIGRFVGSVHTSPGILEKKAHDLEEIIREVRQDIPDASLILADF